MSDDPRGLWNTLTHEQKVKVLAQMPIDQIVATYRDDNHSDEEFRTSLARQLRLWNPQNVQTFKRRGKPPTKDVVLGAWRDLDRSEALLELIDNSIDEWLRRRKMHPQKTAPELNIYIEVDKDSQQLTYEDNAGGVSVDKLEHLVVPGYSDTTALSNTIGSYKTGGKKAVFRLANAVQVTTRYWNPAETSDEALAVQLDEAWINDPDLYEFEYTVLKDKSVIERGQTRYTLQLREEPIGGPAWFEIPTEVEKITNEIRRTYTLLLVRHPRIHIHFLDRGKPLQPLNDLYDFSGTHKSGVDIRPQRVTFELDLDHEGKKENVEIEVVLGSRTSTGSKDGKTWGIDLYGNDRLFVAHDQQTFAHLLPAGNSRSLVRGYVNIKGPNVFIPWDTHKRHLNVDRDIIQILTKHKLIVELFTNWKRTYNDISTSGEIAKLIQQPLAGFVDRKAHDLVLPHDARVKLDPGQKRKVQLGKAVAVPVVRARVAKNHSVAVQLNFSVVEARLLASRYGVEGDLQSSGVRSELAAAIKEELLKKVQKSGK